MSSVIFTVVSLWCCVSNVYWELSAAVFVSFLNLNKRTSVPKYSCTECITRNMGQDGEIVTICRREYKYQNFILCKYFTVSELDICSGVCEQHFYTNFGRILYV